MVAELSSPGEAVGISASLVRHSSALFPSANNKLSIWKNLFLQITNQIMFTWVGFSSLVLMNTKGKLENVYGPDRGNSSASQRQQLPLQHDSSGALPRPQQPHQLPMNLPPALLEKHLLTVSLSQSTCTHIHLQPQSKSGCCP